MNKIITDKEAAQTLDQVRSAQAEIKRRSAKEYAPWIGWGLYVIAFYAPFDFIKPIIWVPISWAAAIIGTLITYNYFRNRHTKIKTAQRTPSYAWALYGLWIGAGAFFAGLLEPHFAYTWTITGIIVGVPFILYGLKLKSQA